MNLLAFGLLLASLITLPGCASGKVISMAESPVELETPVVTTAEGIHQEDNNPVVEAVPPSQPDLPTAETFPPVQPPGQPSTDSPAQRVPPPGQPSSPVPPPGPPSPGGQASGASVINPPAGWAAQELARRGFLRDPSKKLIVLDPGHGGPDIGAAAGSLAEKAVNLDIAWKLKGLLEADGYQVLLTREADQRPYTLAEGRTDRPVTRADLQSRVDLANAARADVFVSIHNNGSSDPAQAGTEVWYAPDRPFGVANWQLATAILDGIVIELGKAGYPSPNRGLKNGSEFRVFQGRVFPLFVLGNPRTENQPTRATQMPGILGESLFLSNAYEASLLAQNRIQLAIAQGYRKGILGYFAPVSQ